MSGWTKLFSSIVTSSVWVESDQTLRVWIAMLATADAAGRVEGSIPGFAHLARVSVEDMRTAVAVLSAPDPDSRTPDAEGRRIIAVPGGWQIVNYRAYRERGQGQSGSRAPYYRAYRRQHVAQYVAQHRTVARIIEAEAEAEITQDPKTDPSCNTPDPKTDPSCSSEPAQTPTPEASPALLRFPVVGTEGGTWPLLASQVATWTTLYPALDVLAETRQALAWILADGARRKTARGMPRFLVGWLARSQNRGTGHRPRDAPVVGDETGADEAQLTAIRASMARTRGEGPT